MRYGTITVLILSVVVCCYVMSRIKKVISREIYISASRAWSHSIGRKILNKKSVIWTRKYICEALKSLMFLILQRHLYSGFLFCVTVRERWTLQSREGFQKTRWFFADFSSPGLFNISAWEGRKSKSSLLGAEPKKEGDGRLFQYKVDYFKRDLSTSGHHVEEHLLRINMAWGLPQKYLKQQL